MCENNRVWAPNRRRSSAVSRASMLVARKSNVGLENPSFIADDQLPMQEVHLGHSKDIRRKSITYLKKELEIDYHEVDIGTLYNRYGSHPDSGLSEDQVRRNREKYGINQLTPPKKEPTWLKFIKTLVGGFQLLLWVGGILSLIAYVTQYIQTGDPPPDNLYLGVVLIVLVIVLGLFTFYQEYSSGKIMESFSKMVPSYANVIREKKLQSINATDLVVGDIVEVKFGDRIPADIRIIECSGFKVDNSSLTGESEPQSRSPQCTDENPMESKNLAYFSTNALEGTAKGIVVATGDGTFIGRIAGLATGLDSLETPMSREVTHFVIFISGVAVFFGVTFFIIALSMGYEIIAAAIFLIGIIVANVPEGEGGSKLISKSFTHISGLTRLIMLPTGLLVTFTVVLALTAKRMADKNCLVKQLHAVETLGSCSVICSDKTGTLTQNKMTVSHLWFGNKIVSAEIGSKDFEKDESGFISLARVATLCSRAKILPDQDNIPIAERKVNGDASESAIIRYMAQMIGNIEDYQEKRKKIFEVPFNSVNKWQLSIHDLNQQNEPRYLGAPERIISLCTKIAINDTVYDLDERWKKTFNDIYEEIGGMGERVIGFCEMMLPADKYPKGFQFDPDNLEFLKDGMTFQGLVSMIDPPRPGVAEAVQTCRTAGIKVVMVTGDHPITAKAIARSVGIIAPHNETVEDVAKRLKVDVEEVDPTQCTAAVISGTELMEMSTPELDEVLKHHTEIVFARVSPQQKLVIVEGFQRLGKIVAVTGDGVNDSPALKKADIGVAMGISGSDVSKQAADMILLDDNFASIVTGVEEGRLIFDNLKKCICYLLAANIAELCPFLFYIVLGIPLALGTIPMLVICLGTDILPTISLSYEKAEGDIMKRPARNPDTDKLVTGQLISYSYGQLGVIESAAGFFAYFVVYAQNGFLPQTLLGIQTRWDSITINDLEDSYRQEWTYYDRKQLEKTGWTAYFCAVVVCQWANVLISKCRRVPLHTKLFDNWVVFAAIFGETLLACFLSYTPGLNTAMSYMPLKIWWWLPGLPFFLVILLYDEARRFLLRNCPKMLWFQREFYY
ncbi:Sodium/potassium-transporting ATPase subunit alpha [Orchesella cincta]|uniref:Sodium/potassium-transporting ATPase subunit alpha n=1 Tax=Orchesella cincta TaxID=48709 RepID=A0A1D2NJL7_ORCCI|nr:Sodium/potassium-transporting ATPase subunit alpha [Orchesella cincta]